MGDLLCASIALPLGQVGKIMFNDVGNIVEIGMYSPEQPVQRYLQHIRNDGEQGGVGQTFPRFPYLKILVMYECLRLLA